MRKIDFAYWLIIVILFIHNVDYIVIYFTFAHIITIMLNKYYSCMSYSFLEYCVMVENNSAFI